MNNRGVMIGIGIVVLVALVGGGVLLANNKKTEVKQEVSAVTEVSPTVAVETTSDTMEATDSAMAGDAKEFVVTGGNFKYDVKEIRVKKGETVRVVFKNSEGTHDFVIDEFDAKTNQIGEGEEEEVEFVADKAGTFEYYCSVGKHRQMGMVGKLIVE